MSNKRGRFMKIARWLFSTSRDFIMLQVKSQDYEVASLIIVNRIDLTLGAVPEQHVFREPLPRELAWRK